MAANTRRRNLMWIRGDGGNIVFFAMGMEMEMEMGMGMGMGMGMAVVPCKPML